MDRDREGRLAEARAAVIAEADAVRALAEQVDEALLRVAEALLQCRGHVLVTGAGTSHAIALRLAHLLSCSGTPALCLDAGDSLHGGAGAIRPDDVLYVISKGGQSAEVNALARIAKQRGALVVAQTEAPEAPLGQMADLVYRVVAPPQVDAYGMIATGSSLVNAAAADLLCVLLLPMRGYTREQFAVTHPGGAVGRRLAQEDAQEAPPC
ncbi:MAG: SIS domain-containing protein [Anaerolineae bacterium]|jgi:D-arabinose 5-phosphate isomerase GutQ